MSGAYSPPLAPGVERALLRWPDVPAAFGWLSLDRRGHWSVPAGRITHPGTLAFLRSHYGADAGGRWFVQNGPQRAFVTLDLAPWVLGLDGHGELVAFNGHRLAAPDMLVVSDEGDLLVASEIGLGNVADRDLGRFVDALEAPGAGSSVTEVLAGTVPGRLRFRGVELAVECLAAAALPARFGFVRQPAPGG